MESSIASSSSGSFDLNSGGASLVRKPAVRFVHHHDAGALEGNLHDFFGASPSELLFWLHFYTL
jgi:hypothetical protein